MHASNRRTLPLAVAMASVSAALAFAAQDPAVKDAPKVDAPKADAPTQDAAPAEAPAQDGSPKSKVIEGPISVYTWAPPDSAKQVDAKDIDLKKVFEDLGPVATRWYQHVITLSNPWFEGRAPGLRGNDLAAEYLEFWMKDAGLEAAFPVPGDDGVTPKDGPWKSYMQKFSLTGGAPKVETAALAAAGSDREKGKDFAVLGISGNAKVEAPVTFVGYGIAKGEGGYSSFEEGADLKGRIAMVFRYEPLDDRGRSKWASRRFSEFAAMTPKVDALVERGAHAIVVAPVFLAAGGHVLRDLPDRLATIAARHPGLSVRVEPALGSLATVIDAMARHCLEALAAAIPGDSDAALQGGSAPQK